MVLRSTWTGNLAQVELGNARAGLGELIQEKQSLDEKLSTAQQRMVGLEIAFDMLKQLTSHLKVVYTNITNLQEAQTTLNQQSRQFDLKFNSYCEQIRNQVDDSQQQTQDITNKKLLTYKENQSFSLSHSDNQSQKLVHKSDEKKRSTNSDGDDMSFSGESSSFASCDDLSVIDNNSTNDKRALQSPFMLKKRKVNSDHSSSCVDNSQQETPRIQTEIMRGTGSPFENHSIYTNIDGNHTNTINHSGNGFINTKTNNKDYTCASNKKHLRKTNLDTTNVDTIKENSLKSTITNNSDEGWDEANINDRQHIVQYKTLPSLQASEAAVPCVMDGPLGNLLDEHISARRNESVSPIVMKEEPDDILEAKSPQLFEEESAAITTNDVRESYSMAHEDSPVRTRGMEAFLDSATINFIKNAISNEYKIHKGNIDHPDVCRSIINSVIQMVGLDSTSTEVHEEIAKRVKKKRRNQRYHEKEMFEAERKGMSVSEYKEYKRKARSQVFPLKSGIEQGLKDNSYE